MGFQRKIEEIRAKPEHIRVRYVWVAVAVCMFFVVIIWLFSLRVNFAQNPDTSSGPINEVREQFDDLGTPEFTGGTSIEDFIDPNAELLEEFRNQQGQPNSLTAPSTGPGTLPSAQDDERKVLEEEFQKQNSVEDSPAATVSGASDRVPDQGLPVVQ